MPKYVIYCSQSTAPKITTDGRLSCTGGASALQVGVLEATLDKPDAASVASVWTAGFSLVITCFLIGRAVGAVLGMIRHG